MDGPRHRPTVRDVTRKQTMEFCPSQIYSEQAALCPLQDMSRTFANQRLHEVVSFTARKRSLGQGNVFTPVCLFTGRGETAYSGVCIWGVGSA